MNQATINKISGWIEELLIEDKDATWDMEGMDDVTPPTVTDLEKAFDSIQSEARKEDVRLKEEARVRAIPSFRFLKLGD